MPRQSQGEIVNWRARARDVINKLGVGKVSDTCGVTPHAVYAWLRNGRGSEDEPIPAPHARRIVRAHWQELTPDDRDALLAPVKAA